MALKPPVEVPQGAIRLNTDSQKLEFFAQDQWWQMATDVPTLDGGARGVIRGGQTPSSTNVIEYVTIPVASNSTDFGDLTQGDGGGDQPYGSRTRAIFTGGVPASNDAEYITISSTGNSIDFGNLTVSTYYSQGWSSQTRGLTVGGYPAPAADTIGYCTIASTGDFVDFGDMLYDVSHGGSVGSPTRGVFGGGYSYPANPNGVENIQYLTIATTGNTVDFGDMSTACHNIGGSGNSIRGVFALGTAHPTVGLNVLEYITIATTGNSADFGDSTVSKTHKAGGCANSTRGLFQGAYVPGGGGADNFIEYIAIPTTGNTVDFGDLTQSSFNAYGTSNAHGGL